jgi:hypothetical protein
MVETASRFDVPDRESLIGSFVAGSGIDGREPFERVLISLSRAYDQKAAQIELALLAASIIDDFAEGRLDDVHPEDAPTLLSNVLGLCSGIRRPVQLWQPLYRLYEMAAERRLDEDVDSESFRWSLQYALIPNQYGCELRQEWINLLAGGNSALGGNSLNGFSGVLHMWKSPGRCEPCVDAIGEAFSLLAKRYESDWNQFDRLLKKARAFWPSYARWNHELILAGLRYEWPGWALSLLDTRMFYARKNDQQRYVCDVVRESVPSKYCLSVVHSWHELELSLVSVDPGVAGFLDLAGPMFERLFSEMSSPQLTGQSAKAMYAHLLNGLSNLRDTPRTLPTCEEARDETTKGLRGDFMGSDIAASLAEKVSPANLEAMLQSCQ